MAQKSPARSPTNHMHLFTWCYANHLFLGSIVAINFYEKNRWIVDRMIKFVTDGLSTLMQITICSKTFRIIWINVDHIVGSYINVDSGYFEHIKYLKETLIWISVANGRKKQKRVQTTSLNYYGTQLYMTGVHMLQKIWLELRMKLKNSFVDTDDCHIIDHASLVKLL